MIRKQASRAFTVTAIKDGVTYEVKSTVETLRIAVGASTGSLTFIASAWKRDGNSTQVAYSCYYAAYSRTGSTYKRLATGSKSTTWNRSLSAISVASAAEAVVIFIADTAMTGSSYANAVPSTYLAKMEIRVVNDGAYYVNEYARGTSRTNYAPQYIEGRSVTSPYDGSPGWSSSAPLASTTYPYIWQRTALYHPDTSTVGEWVYICLTGIDGSRGKIGRMFYLAGKWSSGKSFIRNDNVCPVVEHNNSYWYLDADSSQGDTPSNNSTVWKKAENFGVVLTEALFTLFAKLGSFVVAEDFFISQYGTIYSSTQEKEIDSTNYDHYFGAYGSSIIDTETSDSSVSAAYTFFDENDPMVKTKPSSGSLKFRPALCSNALTSEIYMGKGNIHIGSSGDVTIKGALMYHKVLVDKANNYIRPFTFWKANGTGMDIDASGTVANITLHGDTIIISGRKRDSSYSLFSGITCVGYTIILPPARFFEGMRIRIINGTISGSNGTAASLNPSQINLAVIYRENDMEGYKDNVDLAYTANMIVAAVPVKFRKGTVDFTFVGSPDSAKCTDLTPSSANRFTVFGLMGSPNAPYKSIELVAQKNPYVSTYNTTQNGQDASDYAWMIIEANE